MVILFIQMLNPSGPEDMLHTYIQCTVHPPVCFVACPLWSLLTGLHVHHSAAVCAPP